MRHEVVLSVLTFSTVIFHAKLSMALLNFLPFKPSFVPRLWSSSWNSIPKNTDYHITQCTIDFPYKNVDWAFSVLQLGLPTAPFCAFPPSFPFITWSWENIFQNKGAMYSFGAVLLLGLWISLPVLGFHTGTAPCIDIPPALLPAACTAANTATKGNRLSLPLSWWLCTLEGWHMWKIPVHHSKYGLQCTSH